MYIKKKREMEQNVDSWEDHSLTGRNYEQSLVTIKQFAPQPRRLGASGPPKPAFRPHRRCSQDIQVDLASEQADKELEQVLKFRAKPMKAAEAKQGRQ